MKMMNVTKMMVKMNKEEDEENEKKLDVGCSLIRNHSL
jgi:hypothetical protein